MFTVKLDDDEYAVMQSVIETGRRTLQATSWDWRRLEAVQQRMYNAWQDSRGQQVSDAG